MEFDIAIPERKKYFEARGRTVVTACPGSGKTTCIVFKLKTICAEVEKSNRRAGVLCLSFTNRAVDEIKNAYKMMHGDTIQYPHDVSTIDSFLTQYIVQQFWYLIPDCKTRPIIVNEYELLHRYLWHKYGEEGKKKEACNISGFQSAPSIYKPESISCSDGKYYCGTMEMKDCQQYAKAVVDYRLKHGILTSADALNVAIELLESHREIATIICQRFPYIVVDEAQDTSFNQYRLLFELSKAGLRNLEFVGDINQSIYEWRFARPDMLDKLKSNNAWNSIEFVNNRRSVQRIIDFYSMLVPEAKRNRIISVDVNDLQIPIVIYRYDLSNAAEVITDFEKTCKNNSLYQWLIMTRGRSLGMIISGNHETPDYWKSPIPIAIIKAYVYFFSGETKKAVNILANVCAHLVYGDYGDDRKKEYVETILNDFQKTTFLIDMFYEMPTLNETFSGWNDLMSSYLKEKLNLHFKPDFEVYKFKKKGPKIDEIAKMKLSSFYGTGMINDQAGRKVRTIHSTKGTSTDAVLLFLGENSNGEAVSLNDFKQKKRNDRKTENALCIMFKSSPVSCHCSTDDFFRSKYNENTEGV